MVGNFKGGGFRFTIEQLKHLFPAASMQDIQVVVDELNSHIDLYKLNRPLRRCHLFAQIQEEVGTSLGVPVEGMNYSSSALTLFGYFVAHPKNQDAKKRQIIQERRDNFERIFNWRGFCE